MRKSLPLFTATAILGIGFPATLAVAGAASYPLPVNFTAGIYSNSGYAPPDTNGAVGPSAIAEMINGYYAVYPKISSGGYNTASLSEGLKTFWNNAIANGGGTSPFTTGGATVSNFASDPRLIFDPVSQHWFASAITVPLNSSGDLSQTNDLLVAVSANSDPAGSWTGFAINSVSGSSAITTNNGQYYTAGSIWADFPTLGVNSQGVYLAGNMFTVPNPQNPSSTPAAVDVLAIPKSSLTAASPSITGATLFSNQNYNTYGFTNQPVNDFTGGNNPAYLFSAYDQTTTPVQNLNQTTIASVTSPTLNSPYNLAAFSYQSGGPVAASQPNTTDTLDAGDDRLSSRLILSHGQIWGVQTVLNQSNTSLDAIRWFGVTPATSNSGAPTIQEQGIITDPNHPNSSLFYGSIAVSNNGDIVVAFNESGSGQYASSYAVVGHILSNGSASFGTPFELKAGAADYSLLTGTYRWGDYSTTVVDPSNPNNFWTFQEIPVPGGSWSTQITQIVVPVIWLSTNAPSATAYVWSALGLSTSTGSNWSTQSYPNSSTVIATLVNGTGAAGNTTIDLGVPITVNSLVFGPSAAASTWTIGGDGGHTLTLGGSAPSINVNATAAGGDIATINSPLAGTGWTLNGGIATGDTPGTLILTGNNTFTGTLNIPFGTLRVATTNGSGINSGAATPPAITVGQSAGAPTNAGQIVLTGSGTYNNAFTITGNDTGSANSGADNRVTFGPGALVWSGAGIFTMSGSITVNSFNPSPTSSPGNVNTLTITGGATVNINAAIAGQDNSGSGDVQVAFVSDGTSASQINTYNLNVSPNFHTPQGGWTYVSAADSTLDFNMAGGVTLPQGVSGGAGSDQMVISTFNNPATGGLSRVVWNLGGNTQNLYALNISANGYDYANPIIGASGSLNGGQVVIENGAIATQNLVIAEGATLEIGNNATAITSALTVNPGSTLNLANSATGNGVTINYGSSASPNATIRSELVAGYNAGAWDGTSTTSGVISSATAQSAGLTIGYADGADGVVSGLAAGQEKIMVTLPGDVNLDGTVNLYDFAVLRKNFGLSSGAQWDQGDFNYDGKVNLTDFLLLRSNFGKSLVSAATTTVATPEPATLGLFAIGGLGLLVRRRRARQRSRK